NPAISPWAACRRRSPASSCLKTSKPSTRPFGASRRWASAATRSSRVSRRTAGGSTRAASPGAARRPMRAARAAARTPGGAPDASSAQAGQHTLHVAQHAGHVSAFLHLRDLCLEILQVEAPAPLQLFGDALRLVEVDPGMRFLDQPEDVAHAEDPCRHALGVEGLDAGKLLADAGKLDRLAGDVPDRE